MDTKINPRLIPLSQIVQMDVDPQPFLLDNLIPADCLTLLCGPSDAGKSIFARQLALSVAKGDTELWGIPLKTKYKKAIYVSTEDGYKDWSRKIKASGIPETELENFGDNLTIIIEHENLAKLLSETLKKSPVDLVVVDVLTDNIDGDVNSNKDVRKYFKPFKTIGNQTGAAFLFIHHLSKKGESSGRANKQNVLGSMAIESSVRSVLELRKEADGIRSIEITKGNYVSDEIKQIPIKLELMPNLMYRRVNLLQLHVNAMLSRDELNGRIIQLHAKGLSVRAITDDLNKEGIKIGKTTVGSIIKDYRLSDDKENPLAETPIVEISEVNKELSDNQATRA